MIGYKGWVSCFFLFTFFPVYAQPILNKIDPNGYNVFYHENGNKSSEGNMRNGKPDGYWKTYFESGLLKTEGNRKNYLLDSVWKFYSENGKLNKEITYHTDKKNGLTRTYNTTGTLYSEEFFTDNIRSGFAKFYQPSGKLKRMVRFEKNKENGIGYEFGSDRRIISVMNYRNGFLRSKVPINRFDRRKRKTGIWKEYYPPDENEPFTGYVVKSEGRYINGNKDGYFQYYDREGNLMELLKYDEGEPVLNAEELVVIDIRATYYEDGSVKSEGGYKDGKKHGVFREYDKKGHVSNGFIYRNGEVDAMGIIDAKGNYQGNWKHYFASGELRAEGKYKEGIKIGDWVYYFKDGKVEQKGTYTNGKPDKKWQWWYNNGQLHRDEVYRKGKEDGMAYEYSLTGQLITKGEYLDGLKEGPWFYHVGDHREEGSYIDGMRSGKWEHIYDNDQVGFSGEFIDGNKNGKHRHYYRNGLKMMEGEYIMDQREGEWKFYDKEGNIILMILYRDGIERKIDGTRIKPAFDDDIYE